MKKKIDITEEQIKLLDFCIHFCAKNIISEEENFSPYQYEFLMTRNYCRVVDVHDDWKHLLKLGFVTKYDDGVTYFQVSDKGLAFLSEYHQVCITPYGDVKGNSDIAKLHRVELHVSAELEDIVDLDVSLTKEEYEYLQKDDVFNIEKSSSYFKNKLTKAIFDKIYASIDFKYINEHIKFYIDEKKEVGDEEDFERYKYIHKFCTY